MSESERRSRKLDRKEILVVRKHRKHRECTAVETKRPPAKER